MSWGTVDIIAFNAALDAQEQQMTSRLLPYVVRTGLNGASAAYDGIQEVQSYRANGRNPDISPTSAGFTRRKLSRERVVVTLEVDQRDVRGMLTDPKSSLAEMCIAAVERETDRIIYDAMFAAVLTGESFGTSVTFATEGATAIDATTALTYEKLLEIRAVFIDNEIGNDGQLPICLGISGDEHTDLLSEVELTSADYSRGFVIEAGVIRRALGMDLVAFGAGVTDPILETNSSSERISFALARKGVALGVSLERKVEVKDNPLKVETSIINVIKEMGAVRTQGKRVQQVRLTP